ncbi:hypothetical protein [Nostoc sp.]|uniref:hypothetical protein n=1 Tax=Nostoc sp. TaxID=1180 RepID=UPI002FF0C527
MTLLTAFRQLYVTDITLNEAILLEFQFISCPAKDLPFRPQFLLGERGFSDFAQIC